MTYKIVSPLYVLVPRRLKKDRKIALNLNIYRNLHHSVNGLAKKVYTEMMKEQLQNLNIKTPVEITYQVFKPTKRILDKMNVVSVVSKFLLDAITSYGCWEDDNDNFVKTETILPTEIDRSNPRVEIFIKEI